MMTPIGFRDLNNFKKIWNQILLNLGFKYDPIINQDLYESVIEMYGLEFIKNWPIYYI